MAEATRYISLQCACGGLAVREHFCTTGCADFGCDSGRGGSEERSRQGQVPLVPLTGDQLLVADYVCIARSLSTQKKNIMSLFQAIVPQRQRGPRCCGAPVMSGARTRSNFFFVATSAPNSPITPRSCGVSPMVWPFELSPPHMYNRKKWTGSDIAVDDLGLFEAVFRLLSTTFYRFTAFSTLEASCAQLRLLDFFLAWYGANTPKELVCEDNQK